MRVLWIHEVPAPTGGCERYIAETVGLLKARGVGSSLLYDPNQASDPGFLKGFDAAFPMVDIGRQVADLAPDVVYVHRLAGVRKTREVAGSGVPTARFFHDHTLFCPRSHKYTAFGRRTCTRRVGLGCFACAGCLVKTATGMGIVPPWVLEREQEANRGLAAFVAGSRYMADHLRLHGFPEERIHRIPLYAPSHAPDPAVVRESDLFVFAGQLISGKGVDTLIEATAATPSSIRVVILGEGRFEADYRALAARLGVDHRVTFAGKVSARELGRWYERALAVVVPSRTPETFGLVGAEALGYGTPVIATAVGGSGEWLLDGRTGIAVPPNDAPALARAMDHLHRSPALGRVLGENGRELVRANLSADRHVERLLDLFTALSTKESTHAA